MGAFTNRRWIVRAIVFLVIVLVGSVVILHTPWGKEQVRRVVVSVVETRLGGTLSIAELDYRLWRGEVRVRGIAWTSASRTMSGSAREVAIGLPVGRTGTIEVHAPELRVAASGKSETMTLESLPPWWFDFGWTVEEGRLALEGEDRSLDIEAIDAELDPADGFWDGLVSFGKAELDALELGSAQAHVRIGPASAELTEVRVEGESSWVRGVLQGEANLHIAGGRFQGEGTVRASQTTFGASQPVRIQLPWTLEADVLRIDNGELSGYGGGARVGVTADLRSGRQEVEVSFEGVEPMPSLASRVAGSVSASFEGWDVASGTGKAELELSRAASREGFPL